MSKVTRRRHRRHCHLKPNFLSKSAKKCEKTDRKAVNIMSIVKIYIQFILRVCCVLYQKPTSLDFLLLIGRFKRCKNNRISILRKMTEG